MVGVNVPQPDRVAAQLALQDLGMLDGKKTEDVREIITNQMRIADAAAFARGEGIGFDAFCKFYETLVMAKARQQLRFKLGLQVEGEQHDWRCSYKVMAGFAGCTCGCAPVLFVHMVRLSHCMLGLGLTSTPHWTSGGMFFWDLMLVFPPTPCQ